LAVLFNLCLPWDPVSTISNSMLTWSSLLLSLSYSFLIWTLVSCCFVEFVLANSFHLKNSHNRVCIQTLRMNSSQLHSVQLSNSFHLKKITNLACWCSKMTDELQPASLCAAGWPTVFIQRTRITLFAFKNSGWTPASCTQWGWPTVVLYVRNS
jgi:hypothetical protein